jgi:hypothetical protein
MNLAKYKTLEQLAEAVKTYLGLPNITHGKLKIGSAGAVSVSSGAIAYTQAFHEVSTESGTTDNLDSITGGSEGDFLVLRPVSGDAIIVRQGVGGNIIMVDNVTLNAPEDQIFLLHDGTNWIKITHKNNA